MPTERPGPAALRLVAGSPPSQINTRHPDPWDIVAASRFSELCGHTRRFGRGIAPALNKAVAIGPVQRDDPRLVLRVPASSTRLWRIMQRTHEPAVRLLTIVLGLTAVVAASHTFAQGTWTTGATMPTARVNFAVETLDGTVYALGGFNNAGGALTTVESYDPVTDIWSTATPMSTRRNGVAAAAIDGRLYAIGGDTNSGNGGFLASVEAYDPLSGTWSPRSSMPTARTTPGTGVVNGFIYAIGGYNGVYHTTVEAYDPVTDIWTTKAPMPTARANFEVAVIDGVLYAVGGQTGGVVHAIVEAYDPLTDTWSTRTAMPTARLASSSAVINGILYMIGGTGVDCSFCSVVEAYDPATDTWTVVSPMPTGRYYVATGVVGGSAYAVGGTSAEGIVGVLEVFTPGPAAPPPPPTLPTSRDECKSGGWRAFAIFKNQGDCVSFVSRSGRQPAALEE